MNLKQVAIVSSIQPETHYTRYLMDGFKENGNAPWLLIDRSKENNDYVSHQNSPIAKTVWTKDWRLPYQIWRSVVEAKITVVHLQHEFTMYGKTSGLITFPLTLVGLKLLGKKVVVTIHAIPALDEIDDEFLLMMGINKICPNPFLAKKAFRFFYQLIAFWSDKIIVHSDYTKSVCLTDYQMKAKNVEVIPIGISATHPRNSNLAQIAKHIRLKLEKVDYILFFGYLLERKGLEQLLTAFQKLNRTKPKLKLIIAGGLLAGHEKFGKKLKKLAKNLNISKTVLFTGFINQDEIDYLYQQALCVVLPYVRSISSSLPLSFALGYGKAIVVSDIGTLRGEIEDGVTGVYCQAGNSQSLYESILKIISRADYRKKLEANIKQETDKRTWAKIAQMTSEVYTRLSL